MLLHVLMFRNILIGSFTTPQFVDIEPDVAAKQLARSFAIAYKDDPKKVLAYEDLVLYHIAEFDDESGKLTPLPEKVLLLNCFDEIQRVKVFFSNKAKEIVDKEDDKDGAPVTA